MGKDKSKLSPHGRQSKKVLRDSFQEIIAKKTSQGLVTIEPIPEMVAEKEPTTVYEFKCSACGSTHHSELRKSNGIIGPGFRSWVSELVCACGLKYSPSTFSKKPQVK